MSCEDRIKAKLAYLRDLLIRAEETGSISLEQSCLAKIDVLEEILRSQ